MGPLPCDEIINSFKTSKKPSWWLIFLELKSLKCRSCCVLFFRCCCVFIEKKKAILQTICVAMIFSLMKIPNSFRCPKGGASIFFIGNSCSDTACFGTFCTCWSGQNYNWAGWMVGIDWPDAQVEHSHRGKCWRYQPDYCTNESMCFSEGWRFGK